VNQVVKKTQENSLNPPPVAPYIRRMTRKSPHRHDAIPLQLTLDALEFCARMRGGALEAKSTPLADRVGVYAILDVHGNVKIGKSWQSARSRLDNGQTWSATPLTLVGMVSEDPHDEKAIHKHLREHHIRGEWFRLEGLALELVEMSRVGRGWFDLKRAELEAAA
jgi:hypothetical protein